MNKTQRCVLVQQNLTAFIARTLPPFQTKQVKSHLHHCSACRDTLQHNVVTGIFHNQTGFRNEALQMLENAFEPESYYVEAFIYEGTWPYANNDYY
ncbi:MAG: zf-HC2 domain-containing protein [Chloroflexota bacterium]